MCIYLYLSTYIGTSNRRVLSAVGNLSSYCYEIKKKHIRTQTEHRLANTFFSDVCGPQIVMTCVRSGLFSILLLFAMYRSFKYTCFVYLYLYVHVFMVFIFLFFVSNPPKYASVLFIWSYIGYVCSVCL